MCSNSSAAKSSGRHFFHMTIPQGVPTGTMVNVQVPGRGIVPVKIPEGNVKEVEVPLPDRQVFGSPKKTKLGGDSYGWLFPLEEIFSLLCLRK